MLQISRSQNACGMCHLDVKVMLMSSLYFKLMSVRLYMLVNQQHYHTTAHKKYLHLLQVIDLEVSLNSSVIYIIVLVV